MFVKLTQTDGTALYVNSQTIGHMRRMELGRSTAIWFASARTEVMTVRETPDEIMALLCDAEREQMVRWCKWPSLPELDEGDGDDEDEARQ